MVDTILMTGDASLPPAYFDRLYADDPDPWRFETSDYERGKYGATLNALPRSRFESALEVGCSIGVLTRLLAARCASLLAVDVAEAALGQARRRCADLSQVRFERMQVPEEFPARSFDLIILSEVLYYLAPEAVDRLAATVRACLAPGGCVVLVHYTQPTNYPLSGDAASDRFIAQSGLPVTRQSRQLQYRLDLLEL